MEKVLGLICKVRTSRCNASGGIDYAFTGACASFSLGSLRQRSAAVIL
jgi:hypothetical protein